MGSASGSDDVCAGLACELCHHRAGCAVHEDALTRAQMAVV